MIIGLSASPPNLCIVVTSSSLAALLEKPIASRHLGVRSALERPPILALSADPKDPCGAGHSALLMRLSFVRPLQSASCLVVRVVNIRTRKHYAVLDQRFVSLARHVECLSRQEVGP